MISATRRWPPNGCSWRSTLARFPGVLLDDGERRRIAAERDSAHALLQTVIEAVPGVVYAKDREGRLVFGSGTADRDDLKDHGIVTGYFASSTVA